MAAALEDLQARVSESEREAFPLRWENEALQEDLLDMLRHFEVGFVVSECGGVDAKESAPRRMITALCEIVAERRLQTATATHTIHQPDEPDDSYAKKALAWVREHDIDHEVLWYGEEQVLQYPHNGVTSLLEEAPWMD